MKQEQFIRIRVKLMEQLRQGAEWSDEDILERIEKNCSIPSGDWISCRNFWTMTG